MTTPVVTGTQKYLVDKLHQVGWFIPPYVGVHGIDHVAANIDQGTAFGPKELDHIAASGLVPVIEGTARRIADGQGIHSYDFTGQSGIIKSLIAHSRDYVIAKQIGDVGECLSLLESFEMFLLKVLFANTNKQHTFADGTNRHGMLHAVFADNDFGSPLNFYKVLTGVNALTWMSAVYYGGSGFVPDETPQSKEHARYYRLLSNLASKERPV